jgi:hypothetical protein
MSMTRCCACHLGTISKSNWYNYVIVHKRHQILFCVCVIFFFKFRKHVHDKIICACHLGTISKSNWINYVIVPKWHLLCVCVLCFFLIKKTCPW